MKKIWFTIALVSAIFTANLSAGALTETDKVAADYVQLVLALGQHDKSYVDAYYGPSKWQETANKNKQSLKAILTKKEALLQRLLSQKANNELEKLRLFYLKAQLKALAAKATMLTGEELDFDQQSQALYGTQAPKNELSSFDNTLRELEKVLPGKGELSKRVEAFRSQFIIPENKLKLVFDAAIKACRERTLVYLDLPKNEKFTLEFVKDKPWSGYNWYQGKAYSLIQVNTQLPIQISRAVDLGCHEGYPGHHTYNLLLEENLYHKKGWVEYSVYPLYSPQSLIAEGSANYGIAMAFPGSEKSEFEKSVLYPLAGLNPELSESYEQVNKLISRLSYAGNEVARLYLNKKIDGQEALVLLQKYTLQSEAKATQRVKFFDAYGAYVINYNWGKDIVKNWIEAGPDQSQAGRWKRFSKLLSSPRLPATLD